MADWLDKMYLRKNFWFAISRWPAYSSMANSDSTAATGISQRTGFQYQPSHANVGAAASRMAFS